METNAPAAKAAESAEPRKAPTTEVTLAKAHTHDGKQLAAKATIKVTARQKAFLQEAGVVAADAKQEK